MHSRDPSTAKGIVFIFRVNKCVRNKTDGRKMSVTKGVSIRQIQTDMERYLISGEGGE
jgi:hypothetical protein